MAFITPTILKTALIVLFGDRVDAERTIRVAFRMIFPGELVFYKGFWIVLLCVCHDGRGIQPYEGRIHHAQLIQLPHQIRHNRLQFRVIQLPQKAVIGPVRL